MQEKKYTDDDQTANIGNQQGRVSNLLPMRFNQIFYLNFMIIQQTALAINCQAYIALFKSRNDGKDFQVA
ncbi:MAG: hypothetical protein IJM09_01725 [Neisseriaceae bacterium]|nr:hypothetical protein [Neisseriaceae bacterium]